MTSVRERERELPDLDAEESVDLRRHWVAITTHWWLPVIGLVAGVIVGYLISLGGAQVYKAKATVYLGQPLSQGGVQVQSQATNPSTVRTIVTAESTIQRVARDAGLRADQLRGRISTQAVSGNIAQRRAALQATARPAGRRLGQLLAGDRDGRVSAAIPTTPRTTIATAATPTQTSSRVLGPGWLAWRT